MLLLITVLWTHGAAAHELQPAIADLVVEAEGVTIDLRLNAETRLAGIDASAYSDSNDAPEAEEYDALRALTAQEMISLVEERWREIADGITLVGAQNLRLDLVDVQMDADPELSRETQIILSADLVPEARVVQMGWADTYGPLIVRQERPDAIFATLLDGGEMSPELPVGGVYQETAGEAFVRFVIEGFEHIIPKGLDHILFVLGLFFFALAWGPLLWQVTAFTVAHTVTLALATLGVVNIPDEWMWLVEALIALSITYVAIENILQPKLGWWRPAVVFGFGLLHGLGFASVLGDLGLAQGQFLVSLIAFNIGVEIGQLAVIFGAFVVLMAAVQAAAWARLTDDEIFVQERAVMYRAMSITGSIIIAAIGAYWFVERALL